MASKKPDPKELVEIRRLASDLSKVQITESVKYDLMGHGLTTEDVCSEIVTWIDAGQLMKKVILRGKHAGQEAFELKPRINELLYYVKVTLCDLGERDEYLLLISAHPDR
jgi:hypothetical protein